ncbi:LysR family transcriptional regulator [Sphingomonas jatrophae]|uniref:DNA-binding transcriptional regulator, LysR family n=1 Tax=Sphingomonas jatrophae TaxID=1166337 RepID=A0A1I6LJ21_9SPHN|nr:LysR family transcriptional regulator [Sphingomonas jatrophae]SFS03517.1 DNA-binding transcriptional regulator, LysR family [Sphingomonas jatrophae]
MFDWDDLRVFLAVARTGRIAPAARTLALDATTVARRLSRLERALGAALFEGTGGERRPSARGEALLAHAEAAESAAIAAAGEIAGGAAGASGQVRVSVAEGFATWVLAPAVAAFAAAHPALRLDLVTASGFLDPSRREADLAVMLARPRSGRLVAAKLADYALRLYAAPTYLERHGAPGAAADLGEHRLVGYVPEFVPAPELDYLGELGDALAPAIRSPSINVQHRAIAGGGGIGVLPQFIGDADPGLVPILPDFRLRRSFWLVTHADLRRVARVEAVAAWLRACAATLA